MKEELPPGGLRLDCWGSAGAEESEAPKEMLLPPPGGFLTAMLALGAVTSMAWSPAKTLLPPISLFFRSDTWGGGAWALGELLSWLNTFDL